MATYNGLYAADGSYNVTAVTGATYTGLYALDGSLNVVQKDGTILTGLYHPCGAYNVVLYSSGEARIQHSSGAYLISKAGAYVPNTMRVTVVSGSIT